MDASQKKLLADFVKSLNALKAVGAIGASLEVMVTFGKEDSKERYFVKSRNTTGADGVDFNEYRAKLQ